MLKDDLKCVLIGLNLKIYSDLARLVRKIDATSRFKQVDLTQAAIVSTLKKINGPSLIFISDEVSFSLELLSDLTWQYNADAIVVIVSRKSKPVPIKEPFNNTQFSRIKLDKNDPDNASVLPFLIQAAREKSEFRRCKNLLGVSEKRCQWLVDSSREAVAFISRDMHWYANIAYLNLFGVSSVQELRTITVKDLIISDEHLLFDGFQQNQKKQTESKRSIILSMTRTNGSKFRANAYLIPSVFKGHKCYQLWVREINSLSNESEALSEGNEKPHIPKTTSFSKDLPNEQQPQEVNPFSHLLNEKIDGNRNDSKEKLKDISLDKINDSSNPPKPVTPKITYDQNSLLKGVIRRKEARIVVRPLSYLKSNGLKNKKIKKHQMVSLKVASAQKKGVDDLLVNLPESFNDQMRSVFWNKVKLSRLLQIIVKRKDLSVDLLLRVDEASIIDESFIDWLSPGLNKLGNKSKNLIFLIPSNISDREHKKALIFISKLRQFNCKVALDSFNFSKESIALLKYTKPDYLRLSLPWTRELQGNELNEFKLSATIRQLERKNIKVIAPCSFSKDMRKLFIHSGASFCQERL